MLSQASSYKPGILNQSVTDWLNLVSLKSDHIQYFYLWIMPLGWLTGWKQETCYETAFARQVHCVLCRFDVCNDFSGSRRKWHVDSSPDPSLSHCFNKKIRHVCFCASLPQYHNHLFYLLIVLSFEVCLSQTTVHCCQQLLGGTVTHTCLFMSICCHVLYLAESR